MFSSKSLIVSALTRRSLIHFEFIFVHGVRECSNFILLHVPVQFSQHHLRRILNHCITKEVPTSGSLFCFFSSGHVSLPGIILPSSLGVMGIGSRTSCRHQNPQILKSHRWPFESADFASADTEGQLYLLKKICGPVQFKPMLFKGQLYI